MAGTAPKKYLDPELLRIAAYYSELAYTGILGATLFECRWAFTKAYLVREFDLDVLVWPGTAQLFDFIVDASAIPVPYGSGWCHGGFALQHASVWPEIAAALDPSRELLVTGHSLGGGLAEKTCDMPQVRGYKLPVHMVTFGKPNVHLRSACPSLAYLATQVSCVHGSDIVARVPHIFYGPDPGQDMLYFDNRGHDHWNPTKEFRRHDRGRRDIIHDHSMERYGQRAGQFLEVVTANHKRQV